MQRIDITPSELNELRELYDRGQYLQAYRRSQTIGPLGSWRGSAAQILAGRLAMQIGGLRLGRCLHVRAYRSDPDYPEAVYYFARYLLDRYGAASAWLFMRKRADWTGAPLDLRADWFALMGFVAARLRDFERADLWHTRAEKLSADRPWIWIERAATLEMQELLPQALEAAQRALHLAPWYRAAVQSVAHLLDRLNRPDEAFPLLHQALDHTESSLIAGQLAGMYLERRQFAQARPLLERYRELAPLLEKDGQRWLNARLADTAYFLGDYASARASAALVDEPAYQHFASKLATIEPTDSPPPSLRLDAIVSLPATNSADSLNLPGAALGYLLAYWTQQPPVPVPLPDPVCIDGVPPTADRRYALQQGYVVREFTVTIPVAQALLQRGLPFILTAVDGNYAQSSLVCGVDPFRESLYLREAHLLRELELLFQRFAQRYAGCGPRGLVIVPASESARLDGLDLLDAPLYDCLFTLQECLQRFDRPGAVACLHQMQALAADHRLTLQARCALARFDAHPDQHLQCLAPLIERFPEDNNFQLTKAMHLRERASPQARLDHLRQLALKPEADPLFQQQYAQALLNDPDQFGQAKRLLRKSLMARPFAPAGYYIWANLLWEERRFSEAIDLYRAAANMDENDELLASMYLRAARMCDQASEATRYLQSRFQRSAQQSATPARILFQALTDRDAFPEAFAVLHEALKRRPNDGELLLFLAEMRAQYGELGNLEAYTADSAVLDSPEQYLERAKPLVSPVRYARSAATIAILRSRFAEALAHWQTVLAEEPLAMDACRNVAQLTADTQGRLAALAFLDSHCQRFPHYYPLLQLRLEWLREQGNEPRLRALEELTELCPVDGSAWRELAIVRAEIGDDPGALAALARLGEVEPDTPSYYFTAGRVHGKAGRIDDARAAYRALLRQAIDSEPGIIGLVSLAGDDLKSPGVREKRLAELRFVARELLRQKHTGEGLVAYRDQMLALLEPGVLEPEELLNSLQQIRDHHPQLGIAWSLVIQQLMMTGQPEAALELARQATQRFPLMGRLWVDLAEIHHFQGETDEQIEALHLALRTMPNWSAVARELAEAYQHHQQPDEARRVLERAIARVPLDPINHNYLAELLWEQGECDAAIEQLKQALLLDPSNGWAWSMLINWSARMEQSEVPLEFARELTRRRPGDPRAWLALAKILPSPGPMDPTQHADSISEALAALERVIALDPRNLEAYDLRAERLAESTRYEEALEACRPLGWEGELPLALRGRMAWVEARRGNYAAAIPPMQKLVADRPDFDWGWEQLARWYNETGRPAAYLEAASELVRLREGDPMALTMRGEARLKTGDREGGKADLRSVQQRFPEYHVAGFILFDAQLQDGETEEAARTLSILQEHAANAAVTARQAQLAAQLNDREGALQALRAVACEVDESFRPLQLTINACRQVGCTEEIDQVLHEVWTEEPVFHPAVILAWIECPSGEKASLEVKLQALDRGISRHPQFLPLYDRKAELLAEAQRYDEAIAVCHATGSPQIPTILRGRAAWVEAMRGNLELAISQMKQAVERDPDYIWGWRQLVSWYDQRGEHQLALEAAERLVGLTPSDPSTLDLRGLMRRAVNNHAGAKADFQKAFALDPHFLLAGLHLFDEQLNNHELADAAETLAILQTNSPSPIVQYKTLQLAIQQEQQPTALVALHQLLTDELAAPGLLRVAVDDALRAGYAPGLDRLLREIIDQPKLNPFVGRLWMERRLLHDDEPTALKRLPELLQRGPLGLQALLGLVEWWGRPQHAAALRSLVRQHSELLRSDTHAWGITGVALLQARDYLYTIEWLADWESRPEVQPAMLMVLAIALRCQQRIVDAVRIHRAALALPHLDSTTPMHLLWLAVDSALIGSTHSAREMLGLIEIDQLDQPHRLVYAMADAVVQVQAAPPAERAAAFHRAKAALAQAVAEVDDMPVDIAIVQTYHASVSRIARDAGTLRAKLWALWQRWLPPLKAH
jgi:tetratricopeptide (TPR) repeat protein